MFFRCSPRSGRHQSVFLRRLHAHFRAGPARDRPNHPMAYTLAFDPRTRVAGRQAKVLAAGTVLLPACTTRRIWLGLGARGVDLIELGFFGGAEIHDFESDALNDSHFARARLRLSLSGGGWRRGRGGGGRREVGFDAERDEAVGESALPEEADVRGG